MGQGEQLVVNFPPVPTARLSIVFPRDHHHHQTTLSGASWFQSTNRTSFRSKQRSFAFEKQDTNGISNRSGSARPICQQQRNVNRRELPYLHNRCVCSAYLGKHRLTLSLLRGYMLECQSSNRLYEYQFPVRGAILVIKCRLQHGHTLIRSIT